MLIYKNTFENIKTIGLDFPIEDQFYADELCAIVADGITRDPIGLPGFSVVSEQEAVRKYPRPSGAELAAKEICAKFPSVSGSLKDRLVFCNEAVKNLNDKYIKECDYLENDYYGSVAACIEFQENILKYAYICDCGVIVYDDNGNIKFQTIDDKKVNSDPYKSKSNLPPWYLPECRKIVRSEWRNNQNNIVDGKCVSFGALTGEKTAIEFIKSGEVPLSKNDSIIVYSDGFSEFLHEEEFIKNILDFNSEEFENFIDKKSKEDSSRYGKEKTIVLYRY